MIKLIAYLFSRLPNRFNLLKKLELGVAFFCWKLAIQAKSEGNIPLFNVLIEQAESEYSHAEALCKIEGGYLRFTFAELIKRNAYEWRTISWDSIDKPYQVDGISVRYWLLKIFFGFRKASEFPWKERLAFMTILENFQKEFYQEFLEYIDDKKQQDIIKWIAKDEENHAAMLLSNYYEINGDNSNLIRRWHYRLLTALPFIPIILIFKRGELDA